jgi:rhodanese-related sulfurtransferase
MTPDEAWSAMAADTGAMLIDVRTQAEWAFVGIADTRPLGRAQCFIEWVSFPEMRSNPRFLDMLDAEVQQNRAAALFFLCRSGGRSHDAAMAAAARFAAAGRSMTCINVLEGFEGPLDAEGHRATSGGWKARGLPWRQS